MIQIALILDTIVLLFGYKDLVKTLYDPPNLISKVLPILFFPVPVILKCLLVEKICLKLKFAGRREEIIVQIKN